jgi:hypothetical protein
MLEVIAFVGLITPPSIAVEEPIVPIVVVNPIVLANLPEISLPVPKLVPPSGLLIAVAFTFELATILPFTFTTQL